MLPRRTRAALCAAALFLVALTLSNSQAVDEPSQIKSRYSNPTIPVIIQQKQVNLILTTDVDGIVLCADAPNSTTPTQSLINYEYARKLLRHQLAGLLSTFGIAQLDVPALGIDSLQMPLRVFNIKDQDVSPMALTYFLKEADASGFIGVGYAFRLTDSLFWNLLETSFQYRLTLPQRIESESYAARINQTDYVAGQVASEQNELDWSEPLASVDQADDLNRNNNQGLSFPLHLASFQCEPSSPVDDASSSSSSTTRQVNMFGDLTSSWDVAIDLNSPCLSLPVQFYSALAGWIGLSFNETANLSQLPPNTTRLPSLQFSLTLGGPLHSLDLNTLVINGSWVCIERGASIVHNGASVFAPIETDAASVQRYRLQGSMVLPVYNMQQAPIVFGSMVLSSLGDVIIDGEAKQIALAYPTVPTPPISGLCLPSPECIGQQQFSDRLNACVDPDCSVYYFQSMDTDTKRCVVDPDYLAFVWTSVAVLIAAELLVSHFIQRSVKLATLEQLDTDD